MRHDPQSPLDCRRSDAADFRLKANARNVVQRPEPQSGSGLGYVGRSQILSNHPNHAGTSLDFYSPKSVSVTPTTEFSGPSIARSISDEIAKRAALMVRVFVFFELG